ncbi:hypothetical protein [Lactobacillus crispatus]|uniref:hypothetical protein n=1 Tax=Lactobacillus crispatus TaxID=47770 RepID=UPI0022E20996|nr:hypothetical protein [Lactobacillus crispatus]
MQKRKKEYINALTDFIQNNDLTYSQIGHEVAKNIKKLGINYSSWYKYEDLDAEIRISKLALGAKPTSEETKALALWKLHDADKWRDLYFPNSNEAYVFVKKVFEDETKKVFEQNLDTLHQKLSCFTKSHIRSGINHRRITPTNLSIILLGLLNFHQEDEISLGQRTQKVDLQRYAENWFNTNIQKDPPLVITLTDQLRDTLDLEHSKKKELKQVVLRGLISVL